ncbi:MAG TPA: carbohydrate ABC transporter permease [Clostridia bacterium]|nr:carbohydrate ABC transporter permease [Clostridia bacterium]
MKRTVGDRTFGVFNAVLMVVLCVVTLYPFLYVISMSLGGTVSMSASLIPKDATFSAYDRVFGNRFIGYGFQNTIFRTLVGTGLTLLVTIAASYTLSKRRLPHRSFWTGLCVFTMFFSGGLIPTYLVVQALGLLNSRWALIFPSLLSTYNMIIMRNFFMSLPESLEESAMIDGANDVVILARIVVPTSMPIIATVSLWTAVAHWNAWFDCMIYVQATNIQVLQLVLRRIVIEGTNQLMELNTSNLDYAIASPDSVKSATIVVATVPIILVYPFLQKYFVKGVMVGSLKG